LHIPGTFSERSKQVFQSSEGKSQNVTEIWK